MYGIPAKLGDGRDVRILFRHDRFEEPITVTRAYRGNMVEVNAQTVCSIVTGPREEEEILGLGTALKSIEDNFEKEVGREKALRRAIEAGKRSKKIAVEDSGTLLAAYFTRPRGQRKVKE